MNAIWKSRSKLSALVVRAGGDLIATDSGSVFALDRGGVERWRHAYEPNLDKLLACDAGVAFAVYERDRPTAIVVVGDDGVERWRHEEDLVPTFNGVQARGDRVVAVGSGPANTNLRLVFDAATGALVRRDERKTPGSWNPLTPAGRWWIAQRGDGAHGLERIDPATGAATALTEVAHVALAVGEEAVYVDTTGFEYPSNLIALTIDDGREQWRRPGGPNLKLGLGTDRVALVEESDRGLHAVVRDRSSGDTIWTGDVLAPLPEDNYFQCLVNEHAIVVFGSYSYAAVYTYASPSPLTLHEEVVFHGGCALDGRRYLETRRDGLTCWTLP